MAGGTCTAVRTWCRHERGLGLSWPLFIHYQFSRPESDLQKLQQAPLHVPVSVCSYLTAPILVFRTSSREAPPGNQVL